MNPLDYIDKKLAEMKAAVQRDIEIAIVRESVRWQLSRLLTLDADAKRQADYQAALAAMDGYHHS